MEQKQVTAASRQMLLDSIRASQMLSPHELARVASAHPQTDGPALAQALVAAGLLTRFQMEAITKHNYQELRIGNYDVLDRIGAGGMGTVFKARHRRMKRIVALKVLSRNLAQNQSFVQRFQREMETIARLTHPNVVMAYDANEDTVGHFLVMEFVEGEDLASLVQKRGLLAVPDAVQCLLQAARGLEYAHTQGIIHRDVKPANLLRDVSGTVKVTDLGLARLTSGVISAPGSGLTQSGGILGTVDYMPPEQANDAHSIDHRADIYSLGATLHYLLLGQPVYHGRTLIATLLKHREALIPSLTAARTDVPASLDALFQRLLAKHPDQRPQTMTEVVRALEAILMSLAPSALPIMHATGADAQVAPALDLTPSLQAPQDRTDQTFDVRRGNTQHGQTATILLVEPSRTQAGIIRGFLQTLNMQRIVTVPSGQEALKALGAERPDVLLCAMHLQDMTALELVKKVRAAEPGGGPGFILVSSEAESAEAGLLGKSGHVVMLHKPFGIHELVQALSLASLRFRSLKPPSGGSARPQGSPAVCSPPAKQRDTLRVLIVDDSSAASLHLRSVLQGLGFLHFVEARDGAQAVALTARETFDLIVTDYNMPLLDGCGLLGYLRQNPATAMVQVIMVTTEVNSSRLDLVRELGVAAIVEKAFPAETVRGIVDQLFSS